MVILLLVGVGVVNVIASDSAVLLASSAATNVVNVYSPSGTIITVDPTFIALLPRFSEILKKVI
jgi:hypothetical protein